MVEDQNNLSFSIGRYSGDVQRTLAALEANDVLARIWAKDHTIWKSNPAEINNRLGWLNISEEMLENVQSLENYSLEIRKAGYRHIVLLGMGGSSLTPEVIRLTFQAKEGYPELIVLDTTVPESIQRIKNMINPKTTLFIVSSKSGTTLETMSNYRYWRKIVETDIGKDKAGQNFIAITDKGSPLEKLGAQHGFSRIFLNNVEVGGRYSPFSYFGLLPAALIGTDIKQLLSRANTIRNRSDLLLGAVIGTLNQNGHDKLTIVASPNIRSLGLWIEQLVAESTGKEGKGVIPVNYEPLVNPKHYGNDRLFVYLRLEGDQNQETDDAMTNIKSDGQSLIQINLDDKLDIGTEFFRWQFATAVTAAIIGVHPFDQPHVDLTKSETEEILQSGKLPDINTDTSLREMLDKSVPGDYLAIMAYLQPNEDIELAISKLRKRVVEKYQVATTFGYGPRFLHSTGQMHKGGPSSGIFLQLTSEADVDLPIPDQAYSFRKLLDAQRLGDFQVLKKIHRPIYSYDLSNNSSEGIYKLIESIN